ncbi:MAG: hypothetical protein M4D80_41670 [Myxococcota bacterium]|nr:hypothetical protein [Deltaproteobacteria bacterium]MDQ3341704.1 hypothetical protein [Myxococcota bacterium]
MSKIWDEIKQFSDELELKVHLAGMEAKDKWEELKPRVKELGAKMEDKAEAASARVAEELNNVGGLIKELRDDVVAKVKKSP